MSDKMIICVDDEKTILDSLKSQLVRNFGDEYVYETAEDAQEAIEVIDDAMEDNFNLILIVSDWLMPGMKGDEFLIKVHQKYPKVAKILLSGQVDAQAVEKAKSKANLFKFVSKLWNEIEFMNTIKNALK